MKTTIIKIAAATLLVAFSSLNANAKSWRINSDTRKNAHFTSINAAMSSADVVNGDTLYIDPGVTITGEQTVTKQVTIIGPGFGRTAPHSCSYFANVLKMNTNNIKVVGMIMLGETCVPGDNYVKANYCTIERCKTKSIIIGNIYASSGTYTTIRQCQVSGSIYGDSKTSTQSTNAVIENSIVLSGGKAIYNLYTATVKNCVLQSTSTSNSNYIIQDLSNATIENNILIHTANKANISSGLSNCTLSNNVMSNATPETADKNLHLDSNDKTAIFTCTGSDDDYWQLKDDSPAKGFATDGGDCGVFDGVYPYVVGAMPQGLPYFTKALIPTKPDANGKVNVELEIGIQDE